MYKISISINFRYLPFLMIFLSGLTWFKCIGQPLQWNGKGMLQQNWLGQFKGRIGLIMNRLQLAKMKANEHRRSLSSTTRPHWHTAHYWLAMAPLWLCNACFKECQRAKKENQQYQTSYRSNLTAKSDSAFMYSFVFENKLPVMFFFSVCFVLSVHVECVTGYLFWVRVVF